MSKYIDAKALREQLNIDQIIEIVEDLGGELAQTGSDYYIFSSICHHIDASNHSKKLYLYTKPTPFFLCYSCSTSFDIFELIETRWNLLDKEYTFPDVLNYVVTTLGLETNQIAKSKKIYDNWKADLYRFTNPKTTISKSNMQFNKSILNFFDNTYRQEWIDEGITIDTMEKYRIGWYRLNQQVTIPVFDEYGNLIGIHARNFNPCRLKLYDRKYEPFMSICGDYRFATNNVLYGLNFNKENIRYKKQAILTEAPKSVLMAETILDINNTVALFGMNLSTYKRNMLLNYDIDEIVIAIDKWSNESNGYEIWEKCIMRIVNKLQGFVQISYIEDNTGLLSAKDSPFDKGDKIWNELYSHRRYIC